MKVLLMVVFICASAFCLRLDQPLGVDLKGSELFFDEDDADSFFNDVDDVSKHHNSSSKCHKRLTECHTMSTVLGVLALGLLLINLVTVTWFNRMAIRYLLARCFPRLAPRPEEEDEEPVLRQYDNDDQLHQYH